MFLIFAYIAIFVAAIYLFFKFLVVSSSYLLLIDETFLNKIQDSEDSIIQKFRNPAPSDIVEESNPNDSKKITNELNTYLRMDFFITLILGIIWFIFPKLLFQFTKQELKYLPPDFRYLGQSLSILTLFTTMIPIKTIKKNTYDKKLVLGTKLFCALVILIIQASYIYFYQRITLGNLITAVLLAFWSCNSLCGFLVKRTLQLKEEEKMQLIENRKQKKENKKKRLEKRKQRQEKRKNIFS